MMKLNDKVAVVIGGNSGIGLASAKLFAENGACVAIMARSQEKLDKAIGEIGNRAIGIIGDVTDLESIKRDKELIKTFFQEKTVSFAAA